MAPTGTPTLFVEGQDAIVEQIARCDGHLGVVNLGEGKGTENIDDDLHVDFADTF
jgi:hypothetical protein